MNDPVEQAKVVEEAKVVQEEVDLRTGLKPKPPSSYFSGVMNHLKCCVGSGIFALGFSLKNAGMAVGVPLMVILGMINLHCQHLLLKAGKEVESYSKRKSDFAETGNGAFKYGPKRVQEMGKSFNTLTNTLLVLNQTGILCIYIVFFSESMMRVAHNWNYNGMSIHLWICLAFIPIVLTSVLLTNLKFLGYLSAISNTLMLLGIFLSIYLIASDLPEEFTFEWVGDILHLPMFISITFLAFCAIQVVLPIYMETKVPEKVGSPLGILNVSTTIEILVTVVVGCLSYLKCGKDCKGSVTLNFDKSILAQIVVLFVGIAVMLSYTLNIYIVVEAIFPLIVRKWGPLKHPDLGIFAFRFSYICLTFIMAWSVPLLGQIVALTGALGSTSLSILLPVTFHLVVTWKKSHIMIKAKDIFIIVLGMFSMLVGIGAALMDIVHEIRKISDVPVAGNSTES